MLSFPARTSSRASRQLWRRSSSFVRASRRGRGQKPGHQRNQDPPGAPPWIKVRID